MYLGLGRSWMEPSALAIYLGAGRVVKEKTTRWPAGGRGARCSAHHPGRPHGLQHRACPAILACPWQRPPTQHAVLTNLATPCVRPARHVRVFAHCGHMTHQRAEKCKSYMGDVCATGMQCAHVSTDSCGMGRRDGRGSRSADSWGEGGAARRWGRKAQSSTPGNCRSGQPERHMDTPDQAVPWHARCCHKCKGILCKGPDYPRG